MPRPSDLPPGVTVGMIPGNRPEDEWWETFLDEVSKFDLGALMELPPERLAGSVSALLNLIGAYYTLGFEMGKAEATIVTPFGPAREVEDASS